MKTCTNCNKEKPFLDFYEKSGKRVQPCKACRRTYQNARRQGITAEERRVGMLWWRYKMTVQEYEQMLVEQAGVCAICGHESKNGKRLCVDHDHSCCPGERSCGKCVRGLLCYNCNQALGQFREDVRVLESAVAYLRGA